MSNPQKPYETVWHQQPSLYDIDSYNQNLDKNSKATYNQITAEKQKKLSKSTHNKSKQEIIDHDYKMFVDTTSQFKNMYFHTNYTN